MKPKTGHKDTEGWRILQEPGSLLITTGALYTQFLHGVAEVDVDENLEREGITNWDMLGDRDAFVDGRAARGKRISLTFRDVKKVQKLGKAFPGLGRR